MFFKLFLHKSHKNPVWVSSKTLKHLLILMANKGFVKFLFYYYFFILTCLTVCSSGTLVGFSFDARRKSTSSSPVPTISFLKKNKVFPSQIRVFVADHKNLDTLSKSRIPVDLYLNTTEVENMGRSSKALAISWLKNQLATFHPSINIKNIIVGTSSSNSIAEKQLLLLIPTLNSIHSALKIMNLEHQVKVSVGFSLSVLEKLHKQKSKDLGRVLNFILKYRSFVMVETDISGELNMGDQFIRLIIKSANSAATVIHGTNVPIILNIKSSAVPSAIEVMEFTNKMIESLESCSHIKDKISRIFAEISPIKEFEQEKLNREEQIFHFSHRELHNKYNKKLISKTRRTLLDDINPLTPVTFPSMNPTPTIVTVPSTIPVTVMPTNPAAVPVTVPNTNPVVTSPITAPSTNPVNPLVPGFPVTTPVSVPVTPPITNPVTNFPFPPQTNTPITNPVTTPVTNNPPAAMGGQTWCVAKTGVMESSLQVALDYACGVGDCSAIQSTGSCYNPNTLQNHASYAFNIYYQKNPIPTSCNFGGAAMLVNNNPSTGSCVYPSSSSSTTLTPSTTTPTTTMPSTTTPSTTIPPTTIPPMTIPPTTTGGGASTGISPMVLNSSYPASPTPDIFGTQPPPGSSSTTVSIAVGRQPLLASIILATTVAATTLMMNF